MPAAGVLLFCRLRRCNSTVAAGVPGFTAKTRTGGEQFWALADQMLVRNGDGDKSGLIALAGLIVNDPKNTAYAGQYFPPMAYRKDRMKNPIGLGSPVFWNLEKFA